MKKIKLLEKLNEIDDRIVERAIYIDDKIKLKENKMREKNENIKKILVISSVCISLCCIIIIGLFNFKNSDTNNKIQISNPITEVNSVSEMEEYLGYDVPIIDSKEIKSYIVIGEDKYADLGRIIYNDDSVFNISKGNEDVSGIYGADFEMKENIDNIIVSFYTYDDIRYGIWTNQGYSYSYTSSISDDNIKNDIKYIIENK